LWDFGDNSTNTQPNVAAHVYATTGSYDVCLTAKNAFNNAPFNKPASQECKTINVTGIEDVTLAGSFSIYPNPTTGMITLDINSDGFDKMDVKVFNVLGEVVKSLNLSDVPAQGKYTLDLSAFAKGIYMVRVQTENGVASKKVSLQAGN
jgi:PKD repeat protein